MWLVWKKPTSASGAKGTTQTRDLGEDSFFWGRGRGECCPLALEEESLCFGEREGFHGWLSRGTEKKGRTGKQETPGWPRLVSFRKLRSGSEVPWRWGIFLVVLWFLCESPRAWVFHPLTGELAYRIASRSTYAIWLLLSNDRDSAIPMC